MFSDFEMYSYLLKNLSKQRFEHSIRVRDTAEKMAVYYNIDKEKAKIAGLVHDCAKNLGSEELKQIIIKQGYTINEIYEFNPSIMHGLAGAVIGETIMGIEDEDILNAIAYHTTGRRNMSILEKIIYIADYIEPLRNFPGVDKLRELSFDDLDKALLFSFENTISYVLDRGQLLHLDTINARNYILIEKMR